MFPASHPIDRTSALGGAVADRMAGHVGRTVDLGVRPEHLGLHAREGSAPVSLTLDVVEPMGNEVILYGRAGSNALVARVPPEQVPQAGQTFTLHADLGRLHFFDVETEASLTEQPSEVVAA